MILFGATGFTGRLVAKYIHKQKADIKWAIAGRSQSKLSALMTELVNMQSPRNLPDVLIADASDPKALADVCSEAKIVLNCTGPFRFLGKEVVEACLKAKCTYMDICGEPQFMDKCFLDYHDKAIENNVLIMHACAFDSVPADMGALYTMRLFDELKCSSIESFLTIDCPKGLKGHFTTYESAVHGMGDVKSLKNIRSEVKLKYNPPIITYPGPKLARVTSYKFDDRVGKYVIPFLGSDASVVRSSQRTLAMRTGQNQWPQYSACVTLSDFYAVAAMSVYGSIFSALSSNSWGRSILLTYPETYSGGLFSKTGPSQEQLDNTTFQMHFYAKGFLSRNDKDKDIEKIEKIEKKDGNIDVNIDGNEGVVETVGETIGEAVGSNININTVKQDTLKHDILHNNEEESEKKRVARGETALLKTEVASTQNIIKPCSFNNIFPNRKNVGGKSDNLSNLSDTVPDKFVHVVVKGLEPGYVATPAIFFALALCVLEERNVLPKGGVLTPSSAFYNSTTVFSRLIKAGLEFEIVDIQNGKPGTGFLIGKNKIGRAHV